MFSATWPSSIQKLASEFLSHPVKVTIGSQDLSASHSVTQVRLRQPAAPEFWCAAVPLCPPLQLQRPSGVLPCKLLRQLSSANLNQTSKYTAHAASSTLLCSLSAANCAVD